MKTLEKLVTKENYEAMGFTSPDEVAKAQLGAPMTVYRVQLDQLREYSPGETEPKSLLVDVSRALYPVTVDGEVRSSVAVEGPQGKWRGTDFGAPGLIKALSQYRQSDLDFVVHVGFLGLYFVGQQVEAGLSLTPPARRPEPRVRRRGAPSSRRSLQSTAADRSGIQRRSADVVRFAQ